MNEMQKYREQLEQVHFRPDFESETAELMRRAAEKKELRSMKNKKPIKIIIAAAAAVAMLTTSVFAISAFLSPQEVASRIDAGDVAQAFEEEDAVQLNQSMTIGDYEFTLLGIASGSALEFVNNLAVENPHSYVVMAVKNTDGSPIDPAESLTAPSGKMLTISPFVEGWAPHMVNAWSLSCAGHEITVDGVRYCLFDYTNLELFADRTVYLAVYEGFAPSIEIVKMNDDGTIAFAEGYKGVNGMFSLPVDASKADPEAARQLLIDEGIISENGEEIEPLEDEPVETTVVIVETDGEEYTVTTETASGAIVNDDFSVEIVDELGDEVQSVTGN